MKAFHRFFLRMFCAVVLMKFWWQPDAALCWNDDSLTFFNDSI